jgi:cardiolipin synthase A/B
MQPEEENYKKPTQGWRDILFYTEGHKVSWIRGGKACFEEINALIRAALHSVHFQVYIIESDSTGKDLMNELMAAARRGVSVNVVVDDFGTDKIDESDQQAMLDAGVNFKRFEPFLSTDRFYVGRRLHHKVMVVDDRVAVVSGINIADRYRGTADQKPWIDYAVKVMGPVCLELTDICKVILERSFRPSPPRWPRIFSRKAYLDPQKVWVRVRRNDWLRNFREITSSYNNACRIANRSITIVGGYFLPGRKFLRILANASKRGVDIRIILTQYSDSKLVKLAGEYLYDKLFRSKIRIFEATTSMVHGKVAIVDETWATIGSYNQNHLSAYVSIELNLDIVNYEFASDLNRHLIEVMEKECVEITSDDFQAKSNIFARMIRWSAYLIVKIMLRVLLALNRVFGFDD